MWPERTDPQKFVYEDIAIASYLLILWEEERTNLKLKQKQSFVDLGCGNGLLVYILSEEGHPGTGIDVRHRKIWNLYSRNTYMYLQERALDPTVPGLFPDTDWLIGNHSDELTPWIPVMAARSSYATRYFVLPCCFFDFNCKFVRKNNKVTQYRGYLDFVQEVGKACGFHVEEDSLRIPSTKRICQIGRIRTYPEDMQLLREAVIRDMILRRGCDINAGHNSETLVPMPIKQTSCNGFSGQHAKEKSPWESNQQTDDQLEGKGVQQHIITPVITDNSMDERESLSTQTPITGCNSNASSSQVSPSTFQPRSSQEPMRNCTSLDRSLKDFIVNTVARKLLGFPLNSDKVLSADTGFKVVTSLPASSSVTCTSSWRKGGTVTNLQSEKVRWWILSIEINER